MGNNSGSMGPVIFCALILLAIGLCFYISSTPSAGNSRSWKFNSEINRGTESYKQIAENVFMLRCPDKNRFPEEFKKFTEVYKEYKIISISFAYPPFWDTYIVIDKK